MESGLVDIRHIGDADMPADFLTKWLPAAKLCDSAAYATNCRHRVTDDLRLNDPREAVVSAILDFEIVLGEDALRV